MPLPKITVQEFRGTDGRLHFTVNLATRVAFKRMRRQHYLTRPPAISVDAVNWYRARSLFDRFEAIDRDTGVVRWVDRERFEAKCGQLNRDYGDQYFLPLGDWEIVLPPGGPRPHRVPPQQPVLPLGDLVSSRREAA